MKPMRIILFACALLVAWHADASASVILRYTAIATFVPSEGDPTPRDVTLTGTVTVSDAAYAAGVYSLHQGYSNSRPVVFDNDGVLGFEFGELNFADMVGGEGAFIRIEGGFGPLKLPVLELYNDDTELFAGDRFGSDGTYFGCQNASCRIHDDQWIVERGPSVPEPSTALLAVPALLLLLGRKRGRRRA